MLKNLLKGTPKTYSLEKNGKEKGHINNEELKDMFDKNKVSISSNGILYRNDKKGLIPVLLKNGLMKELSIKD